MTHQSPVDREKEIARFDLMLAGKTEERILLVEAPSNWGKSILLREFGHRRPSDMYFANIDFKVGTTSLAELLSRLCDKLGGWKHFPNLRAELHSIVHPSLNVARNMMVGQNQIEVYLGGRDEQERQVRLSTLTDAFFTDLRSLGKTLIILDTFERSDEVIQKWLTDAFLPRAFHSPKLYIVVGGQRIPERTIEWDCEYIPLDGITHEHWHRYAQSIGVIVEIEYLRICCDFCKGNPYQMKSYIDSYIGIGRIA